MNELAILIADDHEVVRRGLALVLNLEAGFRVVGEACNGVQAITETDRLNPDIVLLDLKMPEMDGRMAAEYIKERHPDSRVILLSGAEIDEEVFDALESGVDGYVSKEVGPQELARAIRIVAAGERYIHVSVTNALLKRVHLRPAGETSPPEPAGMVEKPHLSGREREVMDLMASPLTYREIGQKLFISEETVRTHAKSILGKLGQPNRTQAVVEAVRLGLIQLD
jgi:DNA-binding NarL/FixJ family response regulator